MPKCAHFILSPPFFNILVPTFENLVPVLKNLVRIFNRSICLLWSIWFGQQGGRYVGGRRGLGGVGG